MIASLSTTAGTEAGVATPPPALTGLETARALGHLAKTASELDRALLSFIAAGFVKRGWVQPLDRLLDAAADTLDDKLARITEAATALIERGLLQVEGQKILSIAGLLSIRPTGVLFYIDHEHSAHLTGPLAALTVSTALQRVGEIRTTCAADPTRKLVLGCDVTGVVSRSPESISLFLAAWDGSTPIADALSAGGLFADDDALWAWQDQHGDPAGMPLAAMLFPMAVVEIAGDLGQSLHTLLNHLPDFA